MAEQSATFERIQALRDPKVLAAVSKLEFISRQVVEGIIAGQHKSPYKGFSVEFAEHREYVPGDEIKYVDWKVYGKTDRYVVKEFEEETELRCHFMLDASNSMTYAGKSGKSKLEIGQIIVATLGHLLIQQGDGVGVTLFSDKVQEFIVPRGGTRHYRWLLEEMVKAQPGKDTDMGSAFHELAEKAKRRGVIVIVSDFFDKLESILVGLTHFRHRKHDVICIQVMDRDELTFPFEEMTLFQGLEPSPDLLTEPWQIRQAYLHEVETFTQGLRKGCEDRLIDYLQVLTDDPLELNLAQYLTMRQGR